MNKIETDTGETILVSSSIAERLDKDSLLKQPRTKKQKSVFGSDSNIKLQTINKKTITCKLIECSFENKSLSYVILNVNVYELFVNQKLLTAIDLIEIYNQQNVLYSQTKKVLIKKSVLSLETNKAILYFS